MSATAYDDPWPHPHHRCPTCGGTEGAPDEAAVLVCSACGAGMETDYDAMAACGQECAAKEPKL